MSFADLSLPAKIAMGLALAGFFVTVETFQKTSENGVLTSCSYSDYGAVALGAGAGVVGIVAVILGIARRDTTSAALAAGAIAIAAWHLASGLGLVGGPCA